MNRFCLVYIISFDKKLIRFIVRYRYFKKLVKMNKIDITEKQRRSMIDCCHLDEQISEYGQAS